MKTHIFEGNPLDCPNSLCNRPVKVAIHVDWVLKKINKNKDWCLICKNLFNANHAVKYRKELK